MNTLEPKAIIRRYYEEIGNQRQLAVADEIIAPDFKLFPDSQPPYGPEGVKQFISRLSITTLPDLHGTIEHLIAEGEMVAAGVTLHATHTTPLDWLGGLAPVPPTGNVFALREFVFCWDTDGKIVERQIGVGTWGMLDQLCGPEKLYF